MAMKKTEWIFLALGVGLFAALLTRVGWGEVWQALQGVGWYFLLVLALSGGRYLARTVAWRHAFAADRALPSFGEMFQARLAGDTLGYLSFAGPLLGEPAKAALLRQQVPLRIGLGGALLEAGTFALTSGFVLLAGLVPAVFRFTLPEQLERAGWVIAGLFLLFWLGGRTLLKRRMRFATGLLNALRRTPLRRWAEPRRERIEQAEQQLLDFYAAHTRRFRFMFLWDCAAQAFALGEIYVILVAMGLHVSWMEVLILEAVGKLISLVFFFVPGRVGVDEGGQAALFQWLGYGAARGIGLALVQRLRALVWAALGVMILTRYAVRRPG